MKDLKEMSKKELRLEVEHLRQELEWYQEIDKFKTQITRLLSSITDCEHLKELRTAASILDYSAFISEMENKQGCENDLKYKIAIEKVCAMGFLNDLKDLEKVESCCSFIAAVYRHENRGGQE